MELARAERRCSLSPGEECRTYLLSRVDDRSKSHDDEWAKLSLTNSQEEYDRVGSSFMGSEITSARNE